MVGLTQFERYIFQGEGLLARKGNLQRIWSPRAHIGKIENTVLSCDGVVGCSGWRVNGGYGGTGKCVAIIVFYNTTHFTCGDLRK